MNVGIKTSSSVLLPIWASGVSGRFDKPEVDEANKPKSKKGKKADASGDVAMDGGKSEAKKAAPVAVASKAKGKRPAEDAEEDTSKPTSVTATKKAKTVSAPAPTPASTVSASTPAAKKKAAAPERKKTAGGAGAGKKLKAGVLGKAK